MTERAGAIQSRFWPIVGSHRARLTRSPSTTSPHLPEEGIAAPWRVDQPAF